MLPSNVMSFMRKIVSPSVQTTSSEDEQRKSKMKKLKETFTSGIPSTTTARDRTPPTREPVDLSQLLVNMTTEEQTIIQKVMERQQMFEEEAAASSKASRVPDAGRPPRGNTCRICLKALSSVDVYTLCKECQQNVCEDCDIKPEGRDESFVCSICRRRRTKASRAQYEAAGGISPIQDLTEEGAVGGMPSPASERERPTSASSEVQETKPKKVKETTRKGHREEGHEHHRKPQMERRSSLSRPPRVGSDEEDSRQTERRQLAREMPREDTPVKEPLSSSGRDKLGLPEKNRRPSDSSWHQHMSVPERERRASDVWDKTAFAEKESARRHSTIAPDKGQRHSEANQERKYDARLGVANKERRASDIRITHQDKERRASEIPIKVSVPEKDRRSSEIPVKITVPEKDRRPSEVSVKISVPEKEKKSTERVGLQEKVSHVERISDSERSHRPSDVHDRISIPEKSRRASESYGDRIYVPDKDRRPSEASLNQMAEKDRRASEMHERIVVPEKDRRSSEIYERMAAPETDRRPSETYERIIQDKEKRPIKMYIEKDRRPSESYIERISIIDQDPRTDKFERIVIPEKDRRPSEGYIDRIAVPDKDRRPSDQWERLIVQERRPSELWEPGTDKDRRPSDASLQSDQDRRSSDNWERDSEFGRRNSDTWERMASIDFERHPSDSWDRLHLPELIIRRLSDTGPAREIQIPEQPRRLSDTGPPREHLLVVPDRRLSELVSFLGERTPCLERRLSEASHHYARSSSTAGAPPPRRGRRMSEVVLTLDGAFVFDRQSVSPSQETGTSRFSRLERQPSEVTRFWTKGTPRERRLSETGPKIDRSSLSMDTGWEPKERRLSEFESSREMTERRPSDVSATWDKGSQERNLDWNARHEGRSNRPPSLRYTLSDSLHDSFGESSKQEFKLSPRGSMTSGSSASEGEDVEGRSEWKRRRSRIKRRNRTQQPLQEGEVGTSPGNMSPGTRLSRHFSWDTDAQRRRSSGSSELSDAGADVHAPPILSRKEGKERETHYRSSRTHHTRQRSIRKQPPTIYVDDGEETVQKATIESSPSPEHSTSMNLLRRQSRGDTRPAISDSEANEAKEIEAESRDPRKPRRSWPEVIPKGFETGNSELHHGKSMLNMLKNNPPPGGFVIPRQPASGIPHELDDADLRGDFDNIRIVIDDVDDFLARNMKSTVRKIILHRDTSESHRTHGLGMRVVGGKVGANDHLYTYVVWTVKDGLADKAGISTGDRILSWDGESLVDRTFEEVNAIIERSSDSVELVVEKCPSSGFKVDTTEDTASWKVQLKNEVSADLSTQPPCSTRRKLPPIPMQFARGSAMGQVQLQMWYDRAKHELVVTVIGCRGLLPRPSTADQTAPQAYLRLQLTLVRNTTTFKTKVTVPSFNPTWNEVFVFECTTPDDIVDGHLEISVWDFYHEGSAEFLGETALFLRNTNLDNEPTWHKLHEHRRRSTSQVGPTQEENSRSARAKHRSMRRAEFQHSRSLSDEMSELELLQPTNGNIVKSSSVDWSRMQLHPDQAWDRGRRRSSSSSAGEQSEPCRPLNHVTSISQAAPHQTSMTDTEEQSTDNRSRSKSFKFTRRDTQNDGSGGGGENRPRRRFSQRMKKLSRSLSLKSEKLAAIATSALAGSSQAPSTEVNENEQEWGPEFLVSPPGTSSSKWQASSSVEQSDEGSDNANKDDQQLSEEDAAPIPLGPGQAIPRGLSMMSKPEDQVTGEIQLGFLMSKGQLEVEVVAARKIIKSVSAQAPNTYVKTYLKEGDRRIHKKKTKVVKHSLDPRFKETLRYSGCDVLGRSFLVILSEKQRGFHQNQGIGMAQIQLDQLDLSKQTLAWYMLYPVTKLVSDSDST